MKKFLLVIAPNFRDEEYFQPKQILEQGGMEVVTTSWQKGEIGGAGGGKTTAELAVKEVKVEDFVGIAFIGGPGMVNNIGDQALLELAKNFADSGKITAAICVAPAILAKAGVLSGKKATAWSGVAEILKSQGANYTGDKVTVDGKIVTADGPASAEEFGKTIMSLL